MATDRDFLGKGWRFPVAVNLTGGVSTSAFEENVRESIFVILGTAPGERVNRPDFGCRIHDLIFAPNNDVTAARAAHYCEEAIYLFERRIEEVKVKAEPNADEPNRLDIRIVYKIAGKSDKKNLVFPFYLLKEEEGQ
ncbi:MAG: GPW/gp25 family protein [Kofleriaceae bacterium]|nr:GPW/gp25 family protein [Myxococcales bacterium]MCB9561029.1 GPW/gp25 family protein [Kofleriaceae bacterium]MCB9574536.1 GPW/gp25 family protein [Kofleriaceae bacterium]